MKIGKLIQKLFKNSQMKKMILSYGNLKKSMCCYLKTENYFFFKIYNKYTYYQGCKFNAYFCIFNSYIFSSLQILRI